MLITLPVEHLYWLYFLFSAEDTLSIFSSHVIDFFLGERNRPVRRMVCESHNILNTCMCKGISKTRLKIEIFLLYNVYVLWVLM